MGELRLKKAKKEKNLPFEWLFNIETQVLSNAYLG